MRIKVKKINEVASLGFFLEERIARSIKTTKRKSSQPKAA
jgi:hypothetical protein